MEPLERPTSSHFYKRQALSYHFPLSLKPCPSDEFWNSRKCLSTSCRCTALPPRNAGYLSDDEFRVDLVQVFYVSLAFIFLFFSFAYYPSVRFKHIFHSSVHSQSCPQNARPRSPFLQGHASRQRHASRCSMGTLRQRRQT